MAGHMERTTNMNTNYRVLAGAMGLCCLFLAGVSHAQMACTMPESPTVPNGRTATEQELIATVAEIKTFQAALADYRECLEAEEAGLGEEVTPEQQQSFVKSFNDSVDEEEAVAAEFNEAVGAFKAANPN